MAARSFPSASSSLADLAFRVGQNDSEVQHLYLSSEALSAGDVLDLTHAMRQNSALTHIYLFNFRWNTTNNNHNTAMAALLRATATLTGLRGLFFHCTDVPVHLLTQILSADHHRLTSLGLRYCKMHLQGANDFEGLEAALRANATLLDVSMECCEWRGLQMDRNGNSQNFVTDSIVQAFAGIPTLQSVEYVQPAASSSSSVHSHDQRRQRLSDASLQAIGKIPELTSLRLRNVGLDQDSVALLCCSLLDNNGNDRNNTKNNNNDNNNHSKKNSKLEQLIVSCDLGNTSAAALSQLLKTPNQGSSAVACPRLQQFGLCVDHLENADCPELLAHALVSNSALKQFHLSGNAASKMSDTAKAAFGNMMQTNFTLENVRLDVTDYNLQAQIAFYIQLNHKGRRDLFDSLQQQRQQQQQTVQQSQDQTEQPERSWVNALCQNSTDVRALHYFLCLHPALFARVALEKINMQHT